MPDGIDILKIIRHYIKTKISDMLYLE